MQGTPKLRKVHNEPAPAKRVIDATVDELAERVLERIPDVLIAYLEGAIKPPPDYMTRTECGELLRVSVAQIDLLVKRDDDPLPHEIVGDTKRFCRADVHAWVRRQKGRAT